MESNLDPEALPPKWKCCPYLLLIMGEQIEKRINNPETNQEELMNVIESLINFITTCDLRTYSCTEMELVGSVIMKSVSYVLNGRISDILNLIGTLINCADKNRIAFLPHQFSRPIAVRNCVNFVRAVMVGLRNITWSASDVESAGKDYDQFTCLIILYLVHLVDFNTYTSIAVAKTFVYTLERHRHLLTTKAKNTIFLHTIKKIMPTQITIKPYLHKIYDAVMGLVSYQTLEAYLGAIVNTHACYNCSLFIIIEALVKYLPEYIVRKHSSTLGVWVMIGISCQITAPFAKKVSKVLISKISFANYIGFIHQHIYPFEEVFPEPKKNIFKTNKLTHVYTMAIVKFKNDFIKLAESSIKPIELSHLVILGIQRGYIKAVDYSPLIESFFSMDSLECCSNSFKAICCFSKKMDLLTTWHLELFGNFIANVALNELYELEEEMRYFFSHLLVQIHITQNEDLLDDYENFLSFIIQLMFSHMKEKTDFGKGVLLYMAISSVFIKKQLKLRYVLPEHRKKLIEVDDMVYFTLNEICDEDIFESLKNEFICKNLSNGIMLTFFQELFLLRLTRERHQDVLLWAFKVVEEGSYVQTENIIKMIVVHLKYLHTEEIDLFNDNIKEVVNNINNDFDVKKMFPTGTHLALLAAVYREGFCAGMDTQNILSITHKIIIGLDLLIKCSNPVTASRGSKNLLEGFCLNPVELECAIRHGFDFVGHVALKTKHDSVIKESVKISNYIISSTNMRKAMTEAAALLRNICIDIMYPDVPPIRKVFIFQFLETLLESVISSEDNCNSKIRRSAEFRFVIHAISTADNLPDKPLLNRSMSFLVEVINDDNASDNSLTTSVNCLQALVEDPNVAQAIHPYTQTILIQSICLIAKSNWKLKNAILQLHRSFLNIFLGQSSAGLRPINIEVIYFLYPDVVRFLFRKLVGLENDVSPDSTIAILSFFLESHFSDDNFLIAYTRDINETFMNVFFDLVLYNEVSGNFAASVISSLCTSEKIPGIIIEIIDYIQAHFHKMLKNIFRNVITLLKGLYFRYAALDIQITVCDKYSVLVNEGFRNIFRYLSLQSKNYRTMFLMLQINTVSVDQFLGSELFKNSQFTYEERLGVQNYIPYLLKNVSTSSLNNVIKIILNSEVPFGFKSFCLSKSVNRFLGISNDDISVVSSICDVLVVSLLNSSQLNCQYFNSICGNLVLYLLQKLKNIPVNSSLISFIRGQYQKINVNNLYVTSVVVAILSKDLNLLDSDKQFVKSVIKSIKDSFAFEVVERDFYLASTLVYYFKCAGKTDKVTLLLIAFRFLFEEETCDEAFKFVSLIFNIRKTSLLPSTRSLLNKDKLLMYLDNYMVAKFYVELLKYLRTINGHSDKKHGAFNVIDVNYIFLYKNFLRKIIKKELKDVYCSLTKNQCLLLFSRNCFLPF